MATYHNTSLASESVEWGMNTLTQKKRKFNPPIFLASPGSLTLSQAHVELAKRNTIIVNTVAFPLVKIVSKKFCGPPGGWRSLSEHT